eukprot:m.49933 g.49933  ORF g.49933 m.49933 type:complete len:96 (-) comp8986_c0_seq3:1710-1997(-)
MPSGSVSMDCQWVECGISGRSRSLYHITQHWLELPDSWTQWFLPSAGAVGITTPAQHLRSASDIVRLCEEANPVNWDPTKLGLSPTRAQMSPKSR